MRLNKRQKEDATRSMWNLEGLGLSRPEINQLARIQKTLHRWSEGECGADWGWIERDETTGKPYLCRDWTGKAVRSPIRDMEAGALRRLAQIMKNHPTLWSYHQTDPRGCALYIGNRDGMDMDHLGASYNRGIAVWW